MDVPPQNLLGMLQALVTTLPSNLHLDDVLHIFPYYQDLNTIWHGIPSFNGELISSKPGVNHVENLLRIVKSGAKAPADEHENDEMQEDYRAQCHQEALI